MAPVVPTARAARSLRPNIAASKALPARSAIEMSMSCREIDGASLKTKVLVRQVASLSSDEYGCAVKRASVGYDGKPCLPCFALGRTNQAGRLRPMPSCRSPRKILSGMARGTKPRFPRPRVALPWRRRPGQGVLPPVAQWLGRGAADPDAPAGWSRWWHWSAFFLWRC